jgi:AraC-like DNA-binding protein
MAAVVTTENVRIWRPANAGNVLLMAGQTTGYAVDPRDEYVFGVVTKRVMLARRGHARHPVAPGQAVAWDLTGRHCGQALDGQAWGARLMVIDAGELSRVIADLDDDRPPSEIVFPDPVIRHPGMVAGFMRLHDALERANTRLECDERLSEWLRAVVEHGSAKRPAAADLAPTDDRALRVALDYLATHPEQNIGLDELATIAGVGKFRMVRLFRQRLGVTPHVLHIANRIRAARRSLENGDTIAQAALATGFADQSHLHRHFTRVLGVTPGEYQRRLR